MTIFSDGIPEASVDDEFYGEDRFVESAKARYGGTLEEIADGTFDDLQEFLGENLLDDDVTLLLLRRRAKEAEA